MTRVGLIAFFAGGLTFGLVAFAPLGAVLRLAGVGAGTLQWARAEGTLVRGTLSGLKLDGADVGDAELALRPAAMLTGQLKYHVDWKSRHGHGEADLAVSVGGAVSIRDYALDLDLAGLEQAARWVQESGGHVQLEGDLVKFRKNGCSQASGVARSDALERNSAVFGTGWTPMQGNIECEGADLVIALAASNPAGTKLETTLRKPLRAPGRFEARVSGTMPLQLQQVLPIAGFLFDGEAYTYSFVPSDNTGPT